MSPSRSVAGTQAIAVGRTAEIYPWDEERVIKLYRAGSSREYVEREARVSRIAHQLGLPAPGVHDADSDDGLWETDGRLGVVYDWVDGPTMLSDLASRPWMVVAHSKALAALHAQVHSASGSGLPDFRERIARVIERVEGLPEKLRAAARRTLGGLPEGARVCHGDFHPDNVLLRESGPMIVDWGPAACGHPCADVAWTVLLFRFGTPAGQSLAVRAALAAFRGVSLRVYLRTYALLTGATWHDVERWLGVIAVLRLGDRIPEERERLLALIEKRLGERR